MIPFSSSSPFQRWSPNTHGSFGEFSTSLVLSPFILLCLLETAKSWTKHRLYVYIRCLVPKPMDPTPNSELAAKEDELTYDLVLNQPQNDESQKVSDYFRRAFSRVLDIPAALTELARLHTHMSIDEKENVHEIPQSANESNIQLSGGDENIHLSNTLDITSQLHESLNAPSMRSPREFDRISQSADNVRPPALEDETAPRWHRRDVAHARWRPTKTVDSGKHHRISIRAWPTQIQIMTTTPQQSLSTTLQHSHAIWVSIQVFICRFCSSSKARRLCSGLNSPMGNMLTLEQIHSRCSSHISFYTSYRSPTSTPGGYVCSFRCSGVPLGGSEEVPDKSYH